MSESTNARAAAAEHVGGESELKELLQWGADNLGPDAYSDFNTTCKSGDRGKTVAAVSRLKELREVKSRCDRRGIENLSEAPKPFTSKSEFDAEVARLGGSEKASKNAAFRRRCGATPLTKPN